MTTGELSGNYDPMQAAREVLTRSQEALQTAVAIVSPETPDASPMEVFPKPGEVRADDAGLDLSQEQERALRGAAAELGYGRETDRTLSEMGLTGAHVIVEGGQFHKMAAELAMLSADSGARPSSITISATPHRDVIETEAAMAATILGVDKESVAKDELTAARQAATLLPGFEACEDQVIPVTYADDLSNYTVTREQSGQLVTIGHVNGAPVNILRVDRRFFINETTGKKEFKQPGPAELIQIVDGGLKVLRVEGQEPDIAPIAIVTSSTYQASREVGAMAASIKTGRVTGVPTYGTHRLAQVRQEEPKAAAINQLPGELYKIASEVAKLSKLVG